MDAGENRVGRYDPLKSLEPADHRAVADIAARQFLDAIRQRVDLVVLRSAREILGLDEKCLVPRARTTLILPASAWADAGMALVTLSPVTRFVLMLNPAS